MKKNLLIVIVAVVMLLAGGGLAYIMLSKDAVEDGPAAAKVAAAPHRAPPIYLPLDPPFVVNFVHNGTLRYLQLAVSVMARDQAVLDSVKTNMPAIRNNLILFLSNQTYEQLGSREGKEEMRARVLTEINQIIGQEGVPVTPPANAHAAAPTSGTGAATNVEAVYLTAFVMQ